MGRLISARFTPTLHSEQSHTIGTFTSRGINTTHSWLHRNTTQNYALQFHILSFTNSQPTMALSTRGKANADQCSIPWRSALPHTYDPNTNPSGLISFATAENWLVQSELCAFTSNVHISSEAYRYAFSTAGGPRLPSAFAAHMNECFDPYWELNGEDIKVSAAATSMHDILAYSLCAGGEGILTSRPYYGRFELDFGNKAGAKLVTVDTDHEGCFDEGVVEVFQRTLRKSEIDGVKTSAMLVINPHNPLGQWIYTSQLANIS